MTCCNLLADFRGGAWSGRNSCCCCRDLAGNANEPVSKLELVGGEIELSWESPVDWFSDSNGPAKGRSN